MPRHEQLIEQAQELANKHNRAYRVIRVIGIQHGISNPTIVEVVPEWHEQTRTALDKTAKLVGWIAVCYPPNFPE